MRLLPCGLPMGTQSQASMQALMPVQAYKEAGTEAAGLIGVSTALHVSAFVAATLLDISQQVMGMVLAFKPTDPLSRSLRQLDASRTFVFLCGSC